MSDDVLARIEKLLRLPDNNPNKHEAEAAAKMAQKLADAYNIDIAGLNADADARYDALFPGGLYPYQRQLFKAVAELNHCLYWHRKGLSKGEKYKHRMVGSRINVMLANQMAEYLQSTIERITRTEFCRGVPVAYFKKDAHIFREGMVDELCSKIWKQRREDEAEARRQREAQQGSGDGKGLILIDTVIEREERANYDFQYGAGEWDKMKQRQYENLIARQKAEEEYAKWAKEHPEEYAKWAKEHPEEYAAKLEEEAKRQREYAAKQERLAKRRKQTPTTTKADSWL